MTKQRAPKQSKVEKSENSSAKEDDVDGDLPPSENINVGNGDVIPMGDDVDDDTFGQSSISEKSFEELLTATSDTPQDQLTAPSEAPQDLSPNDDSVKIKDRVQTLTSQKSSKAQKISSYKTSCKSSLDKDADDVFIPIDVAKVINARDQTTKIIKTSLKESPKKARKSKSLIDDNDIIDRVIKEEGNAQTHMVIIFDDDDDDVTTPNESQDTMSETDDQNLDNLAKGTFVVTKLHDVVDRKFLDSAGISILKPVLNIELATAECEKVVASIWGENANNVQAWME